MGIHSIKTMIEHSNSYFFALTSYLWINFNLDGINIVVSDECIMSIADEAVAKVFKDDFIKKPINSIKKLLRK